MLSSTGTPPSPSAASGVVSTSPTSRAKAAQLERRKAALAMQSQPAGADSAAVAAVAGTIVAPVPAAAATTSNNGTIAAQAAPRAAPVASKGPHINVVDEKAHAGLIAMLGCVLNQLVAFEEQSHPNGRGPISMFHTAYVPSISIASYLRRVALYGKVSSETLVQSVLHIHQLMQPRPGFGSGAPPLVVNRLNVHRLLLTSIMTTAKAFDDAHYNNNYYAYVGGVPLRELNALEVEFLSLLNFDFFVPGATYAYFVSMVTDPAIHQAGCGCAQHAPFVPRSVHTDEYTPEPEVEFLLGEMEAPEHRPTVELQQAQAPSCSPTASVTTATDVSVTPGSMADVLVSVSASPFTGDSAGSAVSATSSCSSALSNTSSTGSNESAATAAAAAAAPVTVVVVAVPTSSEDAEMAAAATTPRADASATTTVVGPRKHSALHAQLEAQRLQGNMASSTSPVAALAAAAVAATTGVAAVCAVHGSVMRSPSCAPDSPLSSVGSYSHSSGGSSLSQSHSAHSHSLSSYVSGVGAFGHGAHSHSHSQSHSQLSLSRMGGGTGYAGMASRAAAWGCSGGSPSLSSLSGSYDPTWARTPVRAALSLSALQFTPKRNAAAAIAGGADGCCCAGAQSELQQSLQQADDQSVLTGEAPSTPTQTQLAAARKEALLAQYARLNLTPRLGALQARQ